MSERKQILKGYGLATAAAFALTSMYVFSKSALNEVHISQFAFYWFGFAIVLNLTYAIATGRIKAFKGMSRPAFIALNIIGLLELIATVCFFYSLSLIENPAIVSFIGNTNPIFVTLLGFFFLKERFNHIETIGIILTIGGAFVLTYKDIGSLIDFFRQGVGWAVVAALFFAIGGVVARYKIKDLEPCLISLTRAVYLFVFFTILLIYLGKTLVLPTSAYLNIGFGSFSGPFLASICVYSSLKYIEASRLAMVISTRSFFILLVVIMWFGIVPQAYQIAGGIISVCGVVILSMGNLRKDRNRKQISKNADPSGL